MRKYFIFILIMLAVCMYPFLTTLEHLDDGWPENPYVDELFWIPARIVPECRSGTRAVEAQLYFLVFCDRKPGNKVLTQFNGEVKVRKI